MTITAEPLTHDQVHKGQPCDCAEAMRRIIQREEEDRRKEQMPVSQERRRSTDRRAS
jgi:hypothetical protein